jgi:ParB-like chromosome segregation protein Spo0J
MWGNARKHFSQADLEELAASLLDSGEAHHPPVGFLEDPDDGTTVKLFMGERRLRAHRMLRDRGHEQFGMMAVSIRPKPTEAQLHKCSLAENLQRVDLRPSETGEELSRMLGMEDEMSGQARSASVLVVDDNTISRMVTTQRLSAVATCASGGVIPNVP